jgi:hypothetical protein
MCGKCRIILVHRILSLPYQLLICLKIFQTRISKSGYHILKMFAYENMYWKLAIPFTSLILLTTILTKQKNIHRQQIRKINRKPKSYWFCYRWWATRPPSAEIALPRIHGLQLGIEARQCRTEPKVQSLQE